MTVVLKELPPGIVERQPPYMGWREASGVRVEGEYCMYYYCPHCEGWVQGVPNEVRVRSLEGLTGRLGTVWDCRHCEGELAFMGAMA